jgi:hypothetical protein
MRCGYVMWIPVSLPHWDSWHMVDCPLSEGHVGPHADTNYYPLYTTEDCEWFEKQYQFITKELAI